LLLGSETPGAHRERRSTWASRPSSATSTPWGAP
jgi:hypothetical protein